MEMLDTIQLTQNMNGSYTDPSEEFDIVSMIENLKEEPAWVRGELNTRIILKSPEKNIVLVNMHEGTEINSFQENGSVTFRVFQGKLKLHIRKGSLTLNQGESLILYEKTSYRIASMETTSLLLTLSP